MKITAILVLALGLAALLRRQPAALRHWILACAVACAAASPMLSALVPVWHLGITPFAAMTAPNVARPFSAGATPRSILTTPDVAGATPVGTAPATGGHTRSMSWWMNTVWIAGASISAAVVMVGLLRLTFLASRSRPVTSGPWREQADRIGSELRLPRKLVLLHSEHPSLLVTWGTMRPKVIIPAAAITWPRERIAVVLRHELAHVQRGDWAVQVAAEILKSVYWFNPVVWLVRHRLRLESEHACDDAVMNSGVAAPEYASHLLELARALNQQPRTWLPAPPVARPSSLHRRISAMLNDRLNRRPIPRSLRAAVAAALLAITVPIAAAQAPFATVAGTVLDPSGGILPGATLTVSSTQTQTKHEVKSDATGRFEFVGLPAGEYLLEASSMGFAISRDTFTLSAGQVVPKNITLQVGSLQETITVTYSSEGPDAALDHSRAPVRRRAAPAKEPCAAAAVGGRLVPPMKLTDVKPTYPVNLRDSKGSGRVEMDATIGTDGSVTELHVVSSPQADMTDAALEAVRQWQFSPTLLNCTPVEVHMHVLVNFVAQ